MIDLAAIAVSVVGWVGAAASIGAYAMVTQRRIEPDSLLFQGLNIGGAMALAISAMVNGAWPSAVVNLIWIAIGAQAVLSVRRAVIAAVARRAASLLVRHHRPVGELAGALHSAA